MPISHSFALMLLFAFSLAARAETVSLGVPKEIFKKPLPLTLQLCLEAAELAFHKMDREFRVVPVPLKETKNRFKSGKLHGELCRTEAFGRLVPVLDKVPTPVGVIDEAVFILAEEQEISRENWKMARVGILQGVLDTLILAQEVETAMQFKSPAGMTKALRDDTVDALLISRVDYLRFLEDHRLMDNVKILDPSVERKNLYMFVHQKYPELHEQLAAAVKVLENTGMITELRLRIATGG